MNCETCRQMEKHKVKVRVIIESPDGVTMVGSEVTPLGCKANEEAETLAMIKENLERHMKVCRELNIRRAWGMDNTP